MSLIFRSMKPTLPTGWVFPPLRGRSLAAAALAALILACARGGGAAGARTPGEKASASASAAPDTSDPRVRRADLARIQGDSNATVWMVMASDFQCPYCKIWHDSTEPAILREYVRTGKIRLAYVNFPISQHQNAVPAAEAAMCAGAQGKFWEYGNQLFATQDEWSLLPTPQPVYMRLAGAMTLDTAAFGQCLRDHVMIAMIKADQSRAQKSGVRGTPTFFVGSHEIGNAPAQVFRPVLDSAIAEQQRMGKRK